METLYFLFFLGIPAALFILLAVGSTRSQKQETRQVLQDGLLAEAEIISYLRTEDGRRVTYRFVPQGSTASVTCEKLVAGKIKIFEPGERVPVRYMAKYPTISILVPYANHQLPWS